MEININQSIDTKILRFLIWLINFVAHWLAINSWLLIAIKDSNISYVIYQMANLGHQLTNTSQYQFTNFYQLIDTGFLIIY